jgi:aromatic ring-opening dioxygenase catalytic subunit (LigB family)
MNDDTLDALTRRQALAAALGSATAAALPGCAPDIAPSHAGDPGVSPARARMPVVYLPHGGGPWPFIERGFGEPAELDQLASYLRSLQTLPKEKPQAVLVISAHWEEPVVTVMTGERPPLYYDYYGFPEEAYKVTWPAPGHPSIAARVRQLLSASGFATAANGERGFDHGTFVPLKLTYPAADMPTVQLSLKAGLDPAEHLAIGRALATLRDEGVFIVGSGMSYHNMRGLMNPAGERSPAATFDAWLGETIALEAEERARRLTAWASAPSARRSHPREEHLLPLMVIAGAAGSDRGRTAHTGTLNGLPISGYHFG